MFKLTSPANMPATNSNELKSLSKWLEQNSFWNDEVLKVQESEVGGLGVFMKPGASSGLEEDNLLLRVPKSSVLSSKNSFIYSLVVDYESQNPSIDLKSGMHSLVLAYIYEQSAGDKSPWHSYLSSFSHDDESVPICLWTPSEKEALFNTECDLLNMLDVVELVSFYMECVSFANYAQNVVEKPEILAYTSSLTEETSAEDIGEQLVKFGQSVQAVISRAFMVDKHLGLSLVPGADLFNHLSPVANASGIKNRENVHFMCDDDEDLCEECGEVGCSHQDSDMENDLAEGEDSGEEEGEDESEKEENEKDFSHLIEGPEVEIESSESETGGEGEEEEEEEEGESEEEGEECEPEMKEITMADIEDVEKGSESENSDAETDNDDEEVSTLSLSEDEEEDKNLQDSNDRMELAKELSDGSKCCDIVLTRPTEGELFNTYGEDLADAYLLQRYGFISEDNPNDSCLLSVQMFSHLKKEKKSKKEQLDIKLDWYDDIFKLVNDLVGSEPHDEECTESCCGEEKTEIEDSDSFFSKKKAQDNPESWQLSPKVLYNGHPTVQTLALVRLIQMPFKFFLAKFYRCSSERKLEKRIQRYLLDPTISPDEKRVLLQWVKMRLQRYTADKPPQTSRGSMIQALVSQEKNILRRAIQFLET